MRLNRIIAMGVMLMACVSSFGAVEFPPAPNFQKRTNYTDWYKNAARAAGKDNAYELYAKFIPGMTGGDAKEDQWPKFNGMISTEQMVDINTGLPTAARSWFNQPAPWYPARRSKWEASYKELKSTLKKFAAAAKAKSCVTPPNNDGSKDENASRLALISVAHMPKIRQCAFAELDAAWRVGDDGHVSPKQFISGIETALKAASQFRGSLLAQEQLEAFEIRRAIYNQLRWAFAHGVLSPKDAASVSKMLKRIDSKPMDMSPTVAMDCAVWLDNIQYIYGPIGGGGTQLNGNRYRDVTGQSMAGNRFGLGARLEADPSETARAIIAAHQTIAANMGPGYRNAAFGAISKAGSELAEKNNLTKGMLYGYESKYAGHYQSAAKCDADRRGTRILVELMAYKAKHKTFPKKLSKLDKKVLGKDLNDPFTGKNFKYVVSDESPVLYSVGPDGEDDGATPSFEWEPGTDFVFWPIPNSRPALAAAELNALPDSKLSTVSKINEKARDKNVVVAGKVEFTVTQPNKEHGNYYGLIMKDGQREVPVFWYDDTVTIDETVFSKFDGRNIRARGVVTQLGDRWGVQIKDAVDVTIEE